MSSQIPDEWVNEYFLAQMMSCVVYYNVTYISSLPYHFSLFIDMGAWQPWDWKISVISRRVGIYGYSLQILDHKRLASLLQWWCNHNNGIIDYSTDTKQLRFVKFYFCSRLSGISSVASQTWCKTFCPAELLKNNLFNKHFHVQHFKWKDHTYFNQQQLHFKYSAIQWWDILCRF